jgi:hypothetical protein
MRGKERGSTRRAKATCGWSRRGPRWSEEGYPRWAEPVTGGARRRGGSGVRGREGTGGGGAVGHEEATDAVNLGRRRVERQVPRRPELHGGGNGEVAALYAREVLRAAFL